MKPLRCLGRDLIGARIPQVLLKKQRSTRDRAELIRLFQFLMRW